MSRAEPVSPSLYATTQMAFKMAAKRKRMANNLTNIEGPVDRSDGHCQRRQPFLIAVAGGTASGKVCRWILT